MNDFDSESLKVFFIECDQMFDFVNIYRSDYFCIMNLNAGNFEVETISRHSLKV